MSAVLTPILRRKIDEIKRRLLMPDAPISTVTQPAAQPIVRQPAPMIPLNAGPVTTDTMPTGQPIVRESIPAFPITTDPGFAVDAPITRPTSIEAGPVPTLITRSRGGRPTGIIGGADPLSRDIELLNAQEGYKAPRSTKDLLLSTLFGFLGGGLPGAGLNALRYSTNQDVRNQMAVGPEMAQTQGRIQRTLGTQKAMSDLLNEQSMRDYRSAQAEHLLQPGNVQTGEMVDAQGNVIQTQRNPQTGVWEPSVLGNEPIIRKRPTPEKPQPEMTEVNIGGQIFRVPSTSAVNYYGQIGRQANEQNVRTEERTARAQAAETRRVSARARGDDFLQKSQKANQDLATARAAARAVLAKNNTETNYDPKMDLEYQDALDEIRKQEALVTANQRDADAAYREAEQAQQERDQFGGVATRDGGGAPSDLSTARGKGAAMARGAQQPDEPIRRQPTARSTARSRRTPKASRTYTVDLNKYGLQ